jgi:predicted esterase
MSKTPHPPSISCEILEGPSKEKIYWTGPELSEGCLPALFYFSISGEESLTLDPFNQPVAFLANENLRVFSFTLPYHDDGFDKSKAVDLWVEEIENGCDIISSFVQRVVDSINYLIEKQYVDTQSIAAAGLSRGAFIASHVAALHPSINTVLGFAPMTQFRSNSPLAESLALKHFTEQLTGKSIRFYIGNRDMMVGTAKCFDFVEKLANQAYHQRIRPPQVEMFIVPSIGFKGHATAPETFFDGARWLKKMLLK